MCLCANTAYSRQLLLSKAGEIMSWSWCSCTETFRCSRTPPTALFFPPIGSFTSPHCYSFYFFFHYRGCQKDLSLFAYSGYSSDGFHPLSRYTGSNSRNRSIAFPDFRTLRKMTACVLHS